MNIRPIKWHKTQQRRAKGVKIKEFTLLVLTIVRNKKIKSKMRSGSPRILKMNKQMRLKSKLI